MNELTLF